MEQVLKKKAGFNFKVIWFFLKPYKAFLIFLLLLSLLAAIFETVNVAVLYPILTLGLDIEPQLSGNPFLILIHNLARMIPIHDALIANCILFIILVALAFLFGMMFAFYSAKITARIVADYQQRISDKYINSNYQFFIDNKQGELLYKGNRAPVFISLLLSSLLKFAAEIILSISILVLLFSLSWMGTILVIVGGTGFYLFTRYLSLKISYIAGTKQYESSQSQNVILNEYITGVKQIKVFGTSSKWRTSFNKAVINYWQFWRKNNFWLQAPTLVLTLLMFSLIVILVIAIRILYPADFILIIPVFGTFTFAIFRLLPKLAGFGRYGMQITSALPDVELVYGVLMDDRYSKIKDGSKILLKFSSSIEFKYVKFAHKGREAILNGVSFKIEKDKMTAIVGPSGAGKSTIVDLLLRLYDIDDGEIYTDNVNLNEYNISSVLKKIGFVSQESFIYNASAKDNINFGNEYTLPETIEAAKLANAHEFIEQLPQKYESLLGDRGVRLSGGEKQRIAIARAMIRKPEILILDEATSSLDNVSENIVQEAINRVSKNCTTLVIAHRLSTIQNADIIYVLDKGKIVESGTHDQLIKQKGKYWELYNIQKEAD